MSGFWLVVGLIIILHMYIGFEERRQERIERMSYRFLEAVEKQDTQAAAKLAEELGIDINKRQGREGE